MLIYVYIYILVKPQYVRHFTTFYSSLYFWWSCCWNSSRNSCLYGDLLDIPAAEEHSDITFTRFDTEVIARRLSSDLFYGISPKKSTQFENDPDDGMTSDSIDFFSGKKTITLGKDRNLTVIRQHHHKSELVGCGSFIFYLTHKTQPGFVLSLYYC